MNERENALLVYRHQKSEWTPLFPEAIFMTGFWSNNECGLRGEKVSDTIALDVFGVEWALDHGSPMPVPGKYILDDVANWRDIAFPEPKTWDWKFMSEVELKDYDGTKVLTYFCEQGCFDRLTQLLGFENALVALLTDPEECDSFFARMADYKIEVIECVAEHYRPDVFMYTDDLAKADSLFMSPETYRELIKPHHAKIIQAIKNHGMIPEQHTCGKYEEIAEDYAEIGIESFFPSQASNDLVALQKKYGDRVAIVGGYDSQGPAGREDATPEILQEEARRVVKEYAVNGGFICLPMIGDAMNATPEQMMRIGIFCEEFRKTCNELGV